VKKLPPLPSEVPYGALLVYSPRGSSEISVKSREVCYGIKNDRPGLIARAAEVLGEKLTEGLQDFFGEDRILVPLPRSSPMKEGALWPGLRICEEIEKRGLVREVRPCLERRSSVTKSSTAEKGGRPDPEIHAGTMECIGDLLPHQFTLVDDVITRGSTLIGAAAVLKAAFPNATIRGFAVVRTIGKGKSEDVEKIVSPCAGVVRFEHGILNREP